MHEGKIAVVTGGSRGLGFEVARQLGQAGIRVIALARDAARLDAAVTKLADEGIDATAFAADLTAAGTPEAFAGFVGERFGRLDILVNNAGVLIEPKDFARPQEASVFAVSPEVVRATFETNLMAPLRLVQALVPLLTASGRGRVVNVSSGMGQLADMGGYWPGYRISKTALNALTRVLAAELAGTGVKVNAVCPGWCRTDMGGAEAPRSAAEGAAAIVWAALLADDGPNGGFFRDGEAIDW